MFNLTTPVRKNEGTEERRREQLGGAIVAFNRHGVALWATCAGWRPIALDNEDDDGAVEINFTQGRQLPLAS